MSSSGFWQFMDLIILAAGVYGLYAAWVLKKKGQIIKLFLLMKDKNPGDCKDLQGFANCMSPKLRTCAGVMLIYGLIAVLNFYVIDIHTLYWVMVLVFLVVLFWYGLQLKKAVEQYF